jgi:glycosyltransferase involved in cell wall biosynthesis
MKIGLVIYGSLDTLSGGYLYDRKLVEHLKRSGDEVEIVSLPSRSYAHHLLYNLSPAFRSRLGGLNLDVLLQDELNHPSLFLANQWLSGRLSCPIVTIVHHLRSSEAHPRTLMPFYQSVERAYLKGVDGLIYNSETTRRAVETLTGANKPGVVAHPAGDRLNPEIGEEEIIARARQLPPMRVLFLGNLIPRKGLHTLLEALSEMPGKSWRLTVAGSLEMDPAYAQKVQALAGVGGWAEQVNFTGPLDEVRLAEALRVHHVLVVPSTYEGFGIAYLEGMGFGLPAIGTTAGGAVEIITDGKNGYLIDPGDAASLADRLAMLADDRELLARISLAARNRYLAHPRWRETGARIRRFLLEFVRETT